MDRRLFDPATVSARQFEPVDFVAEGAKRYASERGMSWEQPDPQLQNDHVRGYAQGLAFRKSLAAPAERSGIASSYGHAAAHIQDQHEFLTRSTEEGGLGLRHEVVAHDPYPSVQAMADDVRTNRRIQTLATSTTASSGGPRYGDGDWQETPTNQAFDNATNDKFRAVHDVFGHAATGRGFSRHGEEAAYQSHAQMFPAQARSALASETRWQNSFLNYGSENEFPDVGSRRIGMPSWASKTGPYANSWSDTHPQFTVADVHTGGGGAFPHLSTDKELLDSNSGSKGSRDKSDREKAIAGVPYLHSAVDHAMRTAMAQRGMGSVRRAQATQWGEEQLQRGEGGLRGAPKEREAYPSRVTERQEIHGQQVLDTRPGGRVPYPGERDDRSPTARRLGLPF